MRQIIKIVFLLPLIFSFLACSHQENKEKKVEATETQTPVTNSIQKYGAEITEENAISVSEIPALLTKQDSAEVKVAGTIGECCQKKGCWMQVPISDTQEMLVRFKDYGFFVPMDSEGKEIIMEGIVKKEVIPVAQLRHYAEDAGKSKEEIEKITEDEVKISFMATGVIIKG